MKFSRSKAVPILAASLVVLSIAILWLAYAPPVEASHGVCTPPAQKVTYGCCPCNVRKAIYWHCNDNHQWQQSGSACLWGQCCAYPCCV